MRACARQLVRHASLALVVLAALAACGCSSETESELAAWVAVGQGELEYAELIEGDEVELVLGPQGGWHVDLAARLGGVSPDQLLLTYRVWDPPHTAQLAYPTKVQPSPSDDLVLDGVLEQAGQRVVFAIDDPSQVVGRAVLVEVEAIAGGEVMLDARGVTIVDREP